MQVEHWIFVIAVILFLVAACPIRRNVEAFGSSQDIAEPTEGGRAVILVEPRKHPHVKTLLDNLDHRLPKDWALYYFHGKTASSFARLATQGVKNRRISLVPLDSDDMSAMDQHRLFKRRDFWDRIQAEHLLIVTVEVALCGKTEHRIEQFLRHEFLRCNNDVPSVSRTPGLSLRRKSLLMRCLKEQENAARTDIPEDELFQMCLSPGQETGVKEFCSQKASDSSFASYRVHEDISEEQRASFLEYCSEASALRPSESSSPQPAPLLTAADVTAGLGATTQSLYHAYPQRRIQYRGYDDGICMTVPTKCSSLYN